MQFQIKCDTFLRIASICNFFESHTPHDVKEKCNTVRLEITNGKAAVATNVKIAAIEYLGQTVEKDGVAHVILDPQILERCKAESWMDGSLIVNTIPEIAIANISTTNGWVYPENGCYWFEETPLKDWRKWASDKPAKISKGIMWWNLYYVESLLRSSKSGKVIFPQFINTEEPIVLRDRENPNWVGLFMADPTPYEDKVIQPARLLGMVGIVITLKCKVRWRSDTATLLRFDEDNEIWFPNSQINDNGDGTVTMPRDLAKRKGVEEYEA